MIRDHLGQVLAESGPPELLHNTAPIDQETGSEKSGVYRISNPVSVAGQSYGSVEVGIDVSALWEGEITARRWGLALAALELLLVAMFSYGLGSYLLRDIKSLEAGAERLAAGELGYQVSVTGRDELAKIAKLFNHMSSSLRDKQLSQKQHEITLIEARTNAENASREAKRALSLMKATLEATGDGILVVDRSGTIVLANKRFAEMWGVPEHLMAARNDKAVLEHVTNQLADPVKFLHKVELLYNKPAAVSRDTLKFRDGRYFARLSHPQMLGDEIVGRVWSFLDITAQRQAEQRVIQLSQAITEELHQSEHQRGLLQALLHAIPDLVWMKDTEGRFLSCNTAFGALVGAEPAAVLGKTDLDYFSAAIAQPFRADDAAAATSSLPIIREEWVTYNSDKRRVLLQTIKTSVHGHDNKLLGVLGVARDITKMRVLIADLEAARLEAQASNDAKSMFLANMSHELRTPLNSIVGFAQMLEYNPKELLSSSQQKCVNRILKGAQHLLTLINDILDFSKIEAGRVELSIENVDLSSLLEDTKTFIQPLAERRSIKVNISSCFGIFIRVDYTRMKQILLNLLSNGIKYNRPCGSVEIICESRDDGLVAISVTDTGIGISDINQKELFKPFTRLGQECSNIEGTGIGLTITKQLVEMMGGSIDFQSVAGEGSTFTVMMPSSNIPIATTTRPLTTFRTESDSMKGTVVYVEDNPANIELMEMVFSGFGNIQLLTAPNGELGIELIRSSRPDLIILDLNLPGIDGFEVLRLVRQMAEGANIPAIALTAAASRQDIQNGMEAGFVHYLTKPFDIDTLVGTMRDLFKQKETL